MSFYGYRTKESQKSRHFSNSLVEALGNWVTVKKGGSLCCGLRYHLMTVLALGLMKTSVLLKKKNSRRFYLIDIRKLG